jgi:hypothetical protein
MYLSRARRLAHARPRPALDMRNERPRTMNKPMETRVPKSRPNWLRIAALTGVAAALPMLMASDSSATDAEQSHDRHASVPAKLVEEVRSATRQFLDVNAATAAKCGPFLGCVSGPDHGAMGIHLGAEMWVSRHTAPPVLEGQGFHTSPARTGLECPTSSNCTSGRGKTTRRRLRGLKQQGQLQPMSDSGGTALPGVARQVVASREAISLRSHACARRSSRRTV